MPLLGLRDTVTGKKHALVSISSLQLLAQREGKLFCSLDTWYKYIRYFDWVRPWLAKKKKIYKEGIRASAPNQLYFNMLTARSSGFNYPIPSDAPRFKSRDAF